MKAQLRSSILTLGSQLDTVVQYAEMKRLTDNVMMLQRKKPFRFLAVLSFFPGEGKTLFCAAMARAYIDDSGQNKVLLVDTTTRKNPQSLVLKQCFNPPHPMIDFISVEEYKRGSNGSGSGNGNGNGNGANGGQKHMPHALEADSVMDGAVTVMIKRKSDQSIVREMVEERAEQYGLILLDTAPLLAQNKGNIDPLLVARMADASVLVVSKQLLNDANLDGHLRILKDPLINLIGMISNEEFSI
jgi:Mrp family chromosome partitioning ATPase